MNPGLILLLILLLGLEEQKLRLANWLPKFPKGPAISIFQNGLMLIA